MIDWKWIVSRCATALKKLPSQVLTMTLPEVYDLFDYWKQSPPEHELLAIGLRVYTSWKPDGFKPKTEAQAIEEHRKSLEARWKAGVLNVKQMFESQGGQFARRDQQAQAAAP